MSAAISVPAGSDIRISIRPPSLAAAQLMDRRIIRAATLDRLADHQLHLGFHLAAERLSRAAAELRSAAR